MDKTLTKELLTRNFDRIDPLSIDDYIKNGGYEDLKKALKMSPEDIIGQIKTSQLKGRGGAAFPAGIKMDAVRNAQSDIKYLICNADEGEPGNFKDRYLMEKDPHGFIEGMIISAYVTGTKKGYVFIRGEYKKSIDIVNNALEQAKEKGFLGEDILGAGFDLEIEVLSGAGSYVCGEEFSLMRCIEGKAGRSDSKPPFPTEKGLYGKPTQMNNVETFANIPCIINMGADEFVKIGTESSKGTKLISLCGNITNPGVYEVPYGVTIKEIVEKLGGGVPEGRAIKMVQLGGSSGPCIPETLLDIKLDYKEMAEEGINFGSGAVIVMDERVKTLEILKRIAEFFQHESCGKCTPCREGNAHTIILLDRFINNTATENDLKLLKTLNQTMELTSICGLGQAAPAAINSIFRYFPDEFQLANVPERKAV